MVCPNKENEDGNLIIHVQLENGHATGPTLVYDILQFLVNVAICSDEESLRPSSSSDKS